MNSKLLKKIRAALARADAARNDNPNERAIALRQAESLMARYSISLVDLSENEQAELIGELTSEKIKRASVALWPMQVMNALCPLYRCTLVKLEEGRIHVFGHSSNIEILKSMTEYCTASIRREMEVNYYMLPARRPNKTRFKTSFGNGAAGAINQQVKSMVAARDAGEIPDMERGQALVVVNQYKAQFDATTNIMHKTYPQLGKAAGSRSTSASGYDAGKKCGGSINLGGQLGDAAPTRRLR